MFTQTLINIRSLFVPGKRSSFAAHNQDSATKRPGKKADKTNVQLLYHRDIDNIKTIESKPEIMQHDWWIN